MDKPKYRVYVCCGPNCGPKGSVALLDFLTEEVQRTGLGQQVRALPTGCQSHCESGPTMVVYPGPVYYQGVDEARIKRIVAEHLLGGEPVKEYFWTGVKRKIIPGQKPALPVPGAIKWQNIESDAGPTSPKREKSKRSYEDVDDFKW
ncbi:MAG TPA: (2Fe-2S) ferredoxin domain-containing protein [Chloroflexia bacterium]